MITNTEWLEPAKAEPAKAEVKTAVDAPEIKSKLPAK